VFKAKFLTKYPRGVVLLLSTSKMVKAAIIQREIRPRKMKKKKKATIAKRNKDATKTMPVNNSASSGMGSALTSGYSGAKKVKQRKRERKEDANISEMRLLTEIHGKPCARNRLPCDRRKMRKIHLFDPFVRVSKARKGSKAMLERAKQRVLKELSRQQAIGDYKTSPLEQAFLNATGETCLTIDYDWMQKLIRNARFGDASTKEGFRSDEDAFNDNLEIIINSKMPFVEREISCTLLHECLHNTVERNGKPGNPQLSEHLEHTAMALLGDREEQQEYFERYFNLDYINESWLKLAQRKKRRSNPKYLTQVYDYC